MALSHEPPLPPPPLPPALLRLLAVASVATTAPSGLAPSQSFIPSLTTTPTTALVGSTGATAATVMLVELPRLPNQQQQQSSSAPPLAEAATSHAHPQRQSSSPQLATVPPAPATIPPAPATIPPAPATIPPAPATIPPDRVGTPPGVNDPGLADIPPALATSQLRISPLRTSAASSSPRADIPPALAATQLRISPLRASPPPGHADVDIPPALATTQLRISPLRASASPPPLGAGAGRAGGEEDPVNEADAPLREDELIVEPNNGAATTSLSPRAQRRTRSRPPRHTDDLADNLDAIEVRGAIPRGHGDCDPDDDVQSTSPRVESASTSPQSRSRSPPWTDLEVLLGVGDAVDREEEEVPPVTPTSTDFPALPSPLVVRALTGPTPSPLAASCRSVIHTTPAARPSFEMSDRH
ncbi:hypothetical protein PAPYR_8047 [Paratrimastix pyriformis]|uniref:Uncharacterized protein n=1 Tax=Paratrimastix pyriformis TaxID=342808 RepID=A0ABQ8UE50_9EUKA|nr:hypothetical protein PAPYR_8047 [Paratrimastix pyriformis]